MKFKFTLKDGYDFDRGDVKGHAYLTYNDFPGMSAAVFQCRGRHKKMKSLNSDRLYIIVKGKGLFHIKKNKLPVEKGDVIIVPKNIFYSYEGNMKCFLVHSPAFDKTKEVLLNN